LSVLEVGIGMGSTSRTRDDTVPSWKRVKGKIAKGSMTEIVRFLQVRDLLIE
jgi:hypothetical protein